MSLTWSSGLNLFRVPGLRFWKALSVGANTVMPSDELLTWMLICFPIWVVFKRRIKVTNWPPFSRIAVMLMGPAGPGAGAAGWAVTSVERKMAARRRKGARVRWMVAIAFEVLSLMGSRGRELYDFIWMRKNVYLWVVVWL